MSPANIEAEIKASSPLIGQAMAIGDGRPYNVALIMLDPDVAPAFAPGSGIEDTSHGGAGGRSEVLEEVAARRRRGQRAARPRGADQAVHDRCPTDWQPGGDELTPTMKLKRKPIAEKYAAEIEALYSK